MNTTILLKTFATGEPVSDELRKAKEDPLRWTYFGEPRIVQYEALEDGTVVEINFGLKNSWESYELKDELEKRFKAQGSPGFRFHCYAFDEKQTLVIYRRWSKYDEPVLEQFPNLKLLVDRGSVTLYDQSLQRQKGERERARLQEQIAVDDEKAAKDM